MSAQDEEPRQREPTLANSKATQPDWRQELHPDVADVLPDKYHPQVHRELLRVAGASESIVDSITQGFRLSDKNRPIGFYAALPPAALQDLQEADLALETALANHQEELLRILTWEIQIVSCCLSNLLFCQQGDASGGGALVSERVLRPPPYVKRRGWATCPIPVKSNALAILPGCYLRKITSLPPRSSEG